MLNVLKESNQEEKQGLATPSLVTPITDRGRVPSNSVIAVMERGSGVSALSVFLMPVTKGVIALGSCSTSIISLVIVVIELVTFVMAVTSEEASLGTPQSHP